MWFIRNTLTHLHLFLFYSHYEFVKVNLYQCFTIKFKCLHEMSTLIIVLKAYLVSMVEFESCFCDITSEKHFEVYHKL